MLTRIYICLGMFSSLCQQDDDFEYWREIQDNKSIKVVLQKIFWLYMIKQNVEQVSFCKTGYWLVLRMSNVLNIN